jgi:diadenosine tetraphosphate (Ap4A) HIT family hydrolase
VLLTREQLSERVSALLVDCAAARRCSWNVMPVGGQAIPHAHCHLAPRYKDGLYAGRGFRWWFKAFEKPFEKPNGVRDWSYLEE